MDSVSHPNQNQPHNHFRQMYALPQPVNTAAAQRSRGDTSRSPWSTSSQSSIDQLSLTLPSISPRDMNEELYFFEPLQSPSAYLTEPSATSSRPQPRRSPSPPSRSYQATESYSLPRSDSPDLFPGLDNNSRPQSPRLFATRIPNVVDLTESSPVDMAHPTRKRKHSDEEPQVASKRWQTIHDSSEGKLLQSEENEVAQLDMVEVDTDQKYEEFRKKQQAELMKQQNQESADKPVKLAEFQCIICLDNPTDLTVTHCGHLFCSLCLHEALHASTQKKTCPVCRQQINLGKTKEGKQLKNGVFLLEMKLMTARRKEKMPEAASG